MLSITNLNLASSNSAMQHNPPQKSHMSALFKIKLIELSVVKKPLQITLRQHMPVSLSCKNIKQLSEYLNSP